MVATIVHQLNQDLTPEQIKAAGSTRISSTYGRNLPNGGSGTPYTAAMMQSKGDVITISPRIWRQRKARTTTTIIRLADDPDVLDPIRFLREREVVHFQRFGEGLRLALEKLDAKNFYAINPAFDK